jgi:hypothetical protein
VLPSAEIVFVNYGTKEHRELPADEGLVFVDFSPPPDRVKEFVAAGSIVLDHHKTAKGVVDAFGEGGVFGDEVSEPGVSGAVLAFRHVWQPLAEGRDAKEKASAERFATLAGIRDTWQNKSPSWDEACWQSSSLFFFGDWLELQHLFANPEELARRQAVGQALTTRHRRDVARAVDKGCRFTSEKGTRVVVIADAVLTSDAAELVDKDADLLIGFSFEAAEGLNAMMRLSTRSHTTFDCSAFAKTHGGGGHTKAAGFNVALPSASSVAMPAEGPYAFVANLLRAYESR